MSSPDSRPGQPQPLLPEPVPFPAVVQDEVHTIKTRKDENGSLFVQIEQGETVLFSAAVVPHKDKVRVIFDATMHPSTSEAAPTSQQTEASLSAPPVTPATTQEKQTASQESREKDTPVMLYGRFAKRIDTKSSPTGGTMATVRFAEHPGRDKNSYYHSLSEEDRKTLKDMKLYYIEKTDTFWWPVTAFDEKAELLTDVGSDTSYRIFCYPQWLTETNNGKEEQHFTLNLVGVQPVKQTRQSRGQK